MTDFISDQNFIPDESKVSRAPASGSGASFIPDSEFLADETKYDNPAAAFALAAARSPTFGVSDEFLVHTGAMKPETIEAYRKYNPTSNIAGSVVGVGGSLFVPWSPVARLAKIGSGITKAALPAAESIAGAIAPAATRPILNQVLSQAGAHAVGSAIEGAAYGAGESVSEHALGDPELNAEKVISNIGTSAAIGTGLGGLFGSVKGALEGRAIHKAAQAAEKEAIAATQTQAIADAPIVGIKPTSIQTMADKVAEAKYAGNAIEMKQKGVLEDALTRVEMDNPVHPLQVKSLEDKGSRDLYNTFKETPGETGDTLRNHEALQKSELVGKTEKTIKDLSPAAEPTSDAVEGGTRAVKAFTDQYEAEKKILSPIFEELETKIIGTPTEIRNGVISKMTDAVPGVAKMIKIKDGKLIIQKYKTGWGLDKSTYNAVKEALDSLQGRSRNFEYLANIRRGLDQHVDVLTHGQAPGQIRALKAAIMDYMQDAVQEITPNIKVRDTFKRWAINEQERTVIENAFGAGVGAQEFGQISKIKPEMIGDKIFANTANVQAAKKILSPEKFNEILANWLAEAKQAATDKGEFSSNKFASFLRKNHDSLGIAFKDNPGALQRLHDLTTIMRILPDAASVNPSGTAKTLYGMLKGMKFHDITWEGMLAAIPKKIMEKIGEQQQYLNLENELLGKAAQVEGLSTIERAANKTKNFIRRGVDAIFSNELPQRAYIGARAYDYDEHQKIDKSLTDLTSNPQKLIDHISQNTDAISQIAPQTAASLQTTTIRAIQFLDSKRPGKDIQSKPLSPKYKPSRSELSRWHTYYKAVNDPTGALFDVSHGTLVPETMEALTAVYPKLLSEMNVSIVDKMSSHMAKGQHIPYRKKLSLSLFLGTDLVNSLDPKSMLATQNTLAQSNAIQQAGQMGQISSANKKNVGKMKQPNRYLTDAQSAAQEERDS